MSTPSSRNRTKRYLSSISCSSPSSDDDERPHKKLALSLNRLSLSTTPSNEPRDLEMKQRKSYEKDEFTTVIESLSTSTSDSDDDEVLREDSDAPFPRDEAHVTILSEIEKRL